jgi:hypothetical protein
MKTTFKMSKNDIRLGERSSSEFCPIARCIKRTLEPVFVSVGSQTIHLTPRGQHQYIVIDLPELAKDFIHSFDCCWQSEKCVPISFTMDIPEASKCNS